MFSKNNYVVNVSNLISNVKSIHRATGNKVKICAIVKADAYGMGMRAVTEAIKNRVDFFGVASVCEAVKLREYNKVSPVLILGEVNLDAINWCAKNNVSVTVSSLNELRYIEANLHDQLLRVHLKVNSGLNRIGFSSVLQFNKAVAMVRKSTVMTLEGVFTHFATKQNDVEFMQKQHDLFEKFIQNLPSDVIVHCCNSFATMNDKRYFHGMVRPGFALYGEHKCDYPLKRVLNINSQVIFVHKVKSGNTVGYDRTYKAKGDRTIAVIPIGYADGLDRRLSNNFSLIVEGKLAPIVGNICMDVALLDVTDIPNVYVGSKVTLLGSDGECTLTPHDYAQALNTSPYEVLLKFNHKRMNYVVTNE